ncbi:MAG: peptidoglycan DD-metalloendopeptidase family protein [Patescibacteria group bacterium]|nr:peptidoglycan DD-metalloendopeptidase family protein [Patescibacteria group bacterium]
MKRRYFIPVTRFLKYLGRSFAGFSEFFFSYSKKKVISWSVFFEKQKNILVKFFLMKRGRYNRPFLHLAAMGLLGFGALIAPFLADTYPIFSSNAATSNNLQANSESQQSINVDNNVFQTEVSQKPRDKVVIYKVEKGDTLSTVAKKFDISMDTIRWVNDLTGDSLTIGDELQILPVSGIYHKVAKGESVYTIAKKYDTNPQQIVDFPFNEFANPETFALVEGQMLMVPDGVKPAEQPTYIRRQVYIAQGPITISSAGFTWPLRGGISQFASWYHMALDITSPVGTPIVAANSGRISQIILGTWDGGYGDNLYIDSGNGYVTHYAHMSGVNVSVGDDVVAGKTVIGWIGMTGRTTGPHLHFEILRNGVLQNPLSFLQ